MRLSVLPKLPMTINGRRSYEYYISVLSCRDFLVPTTEIFKIHNVSVTAVIGEIFKWPIKDNSRLILHNEHDVYCVRDSDGVIVNDAGFPFRGFADDAKGFGLEGGMGIADDFGFEDASVTPDDEPDFYGTVPVAFSGSLRINQMG